MRLGIAVFALLFLNQLTPLFGQAPPPGKIEISVMGQSSEPLAGVQVRLKAGQHVIASAITDHSGRAKFATVPPAEYDIVAEKEGFETAEKAGLRLLPAGSIILELTMVPVPVRADSIEVHATAAPIEQQGSSVPAELPTQAASQLPSRPATVSDALPLVPGVLRSPEGGLKISGSGEQRSSLLVNSADVTDPATGQFGLTVPIDSVESMDVFQSPFLAEYGRFSAGLVSVETRRGGDQWKWELNDPLPDFFIYSWHLRGLRDATPRLNFDGPLIPGKLYFSEGFEYTVRNTPVYTLPFPYNLTREHGINSFSQLDWVVSDRQLLTATAHFAPEDTEFSNINFFNPQQTSPSSSTRNYTLTAQDRLTLAGGLFENTLSATRFDANVWGQGSEDMTLSPVGNSGNYFAQQDRTASRLGLSSSYSFAPIDLAGSHNVKVGAYLAGSEDQGEVTEHPINIDNSAGEPIEQISFTGGQPYQMSDTEFALFGQDHWVVSHRLALDAGVRAESQEVSDALRLAPRVGIAWNPFASYSTVVRAGFGLFYDNVPLNVYSFNDYPAEVITYDGPNGQASGSPTLYQDTLGQTGSRSPLIFQGSTAGNFSPRSTIWTVEVEQPLSRFLKLKVGYLQNDGSGLIVVNPTAPNPETNTGTYLLSGNGESRYRQLEVTARVKLSTTRELFFSYVRSSSQGDLNDFNNYLGNFPVPLIHNDVFANLPSDIPNRFLTWGALQLPWKFRIAPIFEYRNGFPYAVTDVFQNYVGVPDQTRYPNFLSLDARVSKDFQVNPKYAVRFSLSFYNLTNHFNPEAVYSNTAAPLYGLFFGTRDRHVTGDFDVIF